LNNEELSHSSRRDLQVKLLLLVPKLASVFAAPLNNEELSHSSRRDLQQTCASGFTYNACANCCGYKFTTKAALKDAVTAYSQDKTTAVNTYGEMKCWDVSSITDMYDLFYWSPLNEPIGCWNVGSVTDMSWMFSYATNFNQPIGNWNVVSVTDMRSMFEGATKFNQPMANWNVGSVMYMASMFYDATKFNQDLCSWYNKLASTTTLSSIFSGTSCPNKAIPDFQVKASFCQACALPCPNGFTFNTCANCCGYQFTTKDDLQGAVNGYPVNQATYGKMNCWDVSSITDMSYLFHSSPLNELIGCWNVGSVTKMYWMFYYASNFNQPIGNWNVGSVYDMRSMFGYAINFNQPIENWNVRSVTYMHSMFFEATKFNQPIQSWNVGSATAMDYMFYGATKFNQDLCSWYKKLPSTTTFTKIFSGTSCPNKTIPDFQVKASFCQACALPCPNGFTFNACANCNGCKFTTKTALQNAVRGYPANQATYGVMNCWDVSSITNMEFVFSPSPLNEPIGCWNVDSVTNMFSMFNKAINFNQPITNWNVGSVTDMYSMFEGATNFNQPIANWNVGGLYVLRCYQVQPRFMFMV
jgi:surface protein